MAADSLKRIGDKICQDYLGLNPTSNSTKPPHIANGLFRACIGETCDTRDVHEWVISDGRKDALPSEKIVADYACILEKGEQEKPSSIKLSPIRFFGYGHFLPLDGQRTVEFRSAYWRLHF